MIHGNIILIMINHIVKKKINAMNLVDNIHMNIGKRIDNVIANAYMMVKMEFGYIKKIQKQENVFKR